MNLMRSLYDTINEALLDDVQAERDAARDVVMRISHEVGVDLTASPEDGFVWSHANLLRVVRAVQGMRSQLALAKGLGRLGDSSVQIPLAARGW